MDNTEEKNRETQPSHGPLSQYYRGPLNRLMDDYYKRVAELEEKRDQPVAWITSIVPIEIVNAFDLFPFYPENYAALCAARGVAAELIHIAETKGVPRDVCGYATCNIGSIISGRGAYGKGGLPRPDMLISTRMSCNLHLTWFTYLSRYYQVPLFIMDTPYRSGGAYEERDIQFYIQQLKRLITFIEERAGKSLSPDKLRETLDLSDQATLAWQTISLSRKNIPSLLASRDVFSLMHPMVNMAGRPEPVVFYEDIAGEVKRRLAHGVGDGKKEKYRLIWDLFPPWHDMKLLKMFDEAGAVFVIDLYADAFSGRLDNPDPYMALADKYLFIKSVQRGVADKRKAFERLFREYKLDGAVFMSNRSCRYMSLNQLDLATFIRDRLKKPVLFFEGDHMDPNRHPKETIAKQVQIFLELLSRTS
ncbi:2-hydroxyacyl-CoA dehydratase subunit D [Thermodesulfobacteriota bacterium]